MRKWASGKGRFESKLKDLEEQLVLRKADQQNILLERILSNCSFVSILITFSLTFLNKAILSKRMISQNE